jgi:hypothetical protein
MARREVQNILRRYRRAWKRRRTLLAPVLHWTTPGTVWAIDFSEPPRPIDGCYRYLLAVRDLASGFQLLWLPVTDESADTAVAALETLFREHGPPLVLKSDNGSVFKAHATRRLLERWHIWPLRSPPRWPEYNGACEAGLGSMKTGTHHESVRYGRPGSWTCADTEAARCQANQTARPWGVHGPTPDIVWCRRRALSAGERITFADAVHRRQAGADDAVRPGQCREAALRRSAISRALVDCGLLAIGSFPTRWRTNPPPPA